MPDTFDPPRRHEEPAPVSAQPAAVDLPSIARRRALLRGLGKSAALAGAVAPLSSLATNGAKMRLVKTGANYQCSVSGQMSVMMSGATQAVQCLGMKCADYKDGKNWPLTRYFPKSKKSLPACYFGGVMHSYEDTFKDCFGGGSTNTATIGSLISLSLPTDDSRWVCAVLNSEKMKSSYPYTSAEVVAQYKSGGAARASALSFHRVVAND